MKLASLKGGLDGQLVVVSDDLGWCVSAAEIAPSLKQALADWTRCEPLLRGVSAFLNKGAQRYRRFEPSACVAPLAPQDATPTATPTAMASVQAMDASLTVRRSAAVVVGAVSPGAGRAEAAAAIRLVGLQLSTSAGLIDSMVLVTPDSLGDCFRDGRLVGAPSLELNGAVADAKPLTLDFAGAIQLLARTGAVVEGDRIQLDDPAPRRMMGLNDGALVRYELRDGLSRSTFGAIMLQARVEAPILAAA